MFLNFASEREGIIDPETATEFAAIAATLPAAEASKMKAREVLAGARVQRAAAHDGLRQAVLEAKAVVDLVAVRNQTVPLLRGVKDDARDPRKVLDVATDCLKVLDTAGDEPAAVRARERLTAAVTAYREARTAVKALVLDLRAASQARAAQTAELSETVTCHKAYVLAKAARPDRRELHSRLKAVLPKTGRKSPAAQTPIPVPQKTTATTATTVAS